MSFYDYLKSEELLRLEPTFTVLIMAAAKKAKPEQLNKLQIAFPEVVKEFKKRNTSSIGILNGDKFGVVMGGKRTEHTFRNKKEEKE